MNAKNLQLDQKQEKLKQKPTFVKICPRCSSLDIAITTPGTSANIIFGLPTLYKCRSCGLTNYVFPEVDVNDVNSLKDKVGGNGKSK